MRKFSKTELTLVNEQLEQCNESLNTLKEAFIVTMEARYDLTRESINDICSLETVEGIDDVYVSLHVNFTVEQPDDINKREILEKVHAEYVESILPLENDVKSLEAEKNQLEKNYFEYLRSDEYIAKRKKRIEDIKKELESETDPDKIKKMNNLLNMYDAMDTLSFLFTRVNKNKDDELKNIIQAFFSQDKGSYIMRKFATKCKRVGINYNFYSNCLNLEDKFLPDEYLPFNNFFVFFVIRYIAFADVDKSENRAYISKIVMNLSFLFAHEFKSQDEENDFINLIKTFEDGIMSYKDEFIKNNITWRDHPVRIDRNKQIEAYKQQQVLKKCDKQAENFEVKQAEDTDSGITSPVTE